MNSETETLENTSKMLQEEEEEEEEEEKDQEVEQSKVKLS